MIKGLIINTTGQSTKQIKEILAKIEPDMHFDVIENCDEPVLITLSDQYDVIFTFISPMNSQQLIAKARPYLNAFGIMKKRYVTVKVPRNKVYIDKNSLIGVEVFGKTCYAYTKSKVYTLHRVTLGNLVRILDDPCIVRCHKSYAVNVKYISGFKRENRNNWTPILMEDGGLKCRISAKYADDVFAAYEAYLGQQNVEKC